ncbi:MAG: hypothetical protein KKA81_12135 [Bacteroidetes bacterium]|nr:hypothetical protein [Bacteroidota bacterium]
MKTKKRITLPAIFMLTALALILMSFQEPEGKKGYATMNIYENFSIVNSMIVITYPNDSSEVIDLGPFKYNAEYLKENGITITRTLNMMYDNGYRIVSTTASGKINSNKAMRITTIIWEKE